MISPKKQIISEFLASYLLGLFGLGLVVPFAVSGTITSFIHFGILFGTIIAIVIIIFNPISGAHFNPGVTLSMILRRGLSPKLFIPFAIVQTLGWGLGSFTVYGIFNKQITEWATQTGSNPVSLFYCSTPDLFMGTLMEFLMTALLVLAVFTFIDERIINRPTPAAFPFFMAATIMFLVSLGGGFTGTALNQARDLGPRIFGYIYGLIAGYDVSGVFAGWQWLMYAIVPYLGAVCGALFFDKVVSKLLGEK